MTVNDHRLDELMLAANGRVNGNHQRWDRVVFRGDPASREFIAFWLSDDRVVAGMNVNVWDVNDRRLADPNVPIDQLVAAQRGGVA